MKWYDMSGPETLATLESDMSRGLDSASRPQLLQKYGPNQLSGQEQDSWLKLLLVQFKNPLIIILLIGAGMSFYIDHLVDAIAILVIVVINIAIAFAQEMNMLKSMASLGEMSAPSALVRDSGKWVSVAASDIVPGDIVKLDTGAVVPADLRLIEATQLQIDEAALTGESVPAEKITEAIAKTDCPLGDQHNMAFMSTLVATGNGVGVVVRTGMDTEMGHIADMLYNAEETQTPMQQRVATLSRVLIGAAFTIVAVIVGIGLEQGMDWSEILNTGISLTVAAIPEGLVTVVTIVLTLGAKRMAGDKALTRKLASVETLGSSTFICSDKTGTLTQNKMLVMEAYCAGEFYSIEGKGYEPSGSFKNADGQTLEPLSDEAFAEMLTISSLCNDATLVNENGDAGIQGTPTEGALAVVAAKAGLPKEKLISDGYEILQSFPFDSARKLMSCVVRRPDGGVFVFAKGAPDVLMKRAERIVGKRGEQKLNDISMAEMESAVEQFSSKALRTLAVAYKEVDNSATGWDQEDVEQALTIVGVHGIMDPPRLEVAQAVNECHDAGIGTIMITGDHVGTAQAIATQIGIKASANDNVISGTELDAMNDIELAEVAQSTVVFARVTPEHKLRIVKALQAKNEVVAMTGDGVNDAPALRTANIGVAMGITGTDVAKEASDLVLLDDNFSTIVRAVREGRRIYDNMRKFIRQALTANVSEVSALLFAFLLMGDDPLLTLAPLMILWVNLVSDGIPALALGVDNEEPGIMKRRPVDPSEGFFTDFMASRIVLRGLVLGFVTYFMFDYALDRGASLAYAQTIAFMTLIFGQIVHIFDARTFTTLYRRNPFSNGYLIIAVIGSVVLSLALIYSPVGTIAFGTAPLQFKHLIMVFFISALPTLILSGIKEIFKVKWL